jgi:hypothetical protein
VDIWTGLGRGWCWALVAVVLLAGCGSKEGAEDGDFQLSAGDEEDDEVSDGLVTEGTLGTLPQFAVETALSARQSKFLRCFTSAWGGGNRLVGGEIRFVFRVGADGVVRWAYPIASTVGDLSTERCLLEVARATRFPKPHGGEAEFTWSLGVDPMENVRPPVPLESDHVAAVLSAERSKVLDACLAGARGAYRVTAYISPGGAIMAAGVAARVEAEASIGADAPQAAGDDTMGCVAEQVQKWRVADPGSYTGKVSFDLR